MADSEAACVHSINNVIYAVMRHRQIPITFVNGHLCVMRGWDRALPDGWLVGEAPALPNHGVKKSLLLFYTVTQRASIILYYITFYSSKPIYR